MEEQGDSMRGTGAVETANMHPARPLESQQIALLRIVRPRLFFGAACTIRLSRSAAVLAYVLRGTQLMGT